jgi:KDO2-lipid IV(A) lauroyltransferase
MGAVEAHVQAQARARALRHPFEGPFFRRLAIGGVRHIPMPLKFATMPLWGGIFHALVPSARRAAERNLEAALGPMSPLELKRRSFRLFTNYAQSIANLYALHYDLPLGLEVTTTRGDMLEQMQRERRGAVLATGHIGYWQIAPFLMSKKAYAPLTMAMAEEPNARTAEFEERFRKRLRIVYTTRSPLALVELARIIGQGELVGMQMDRPAGGAAATFDFFGRPAAFPTSPATLARATRSPLIPVFIVAGADRRRCEFLVEDPIEVARTRDREADIAEATQRLVRTYQRYVARYPEQWFNFFDFWGARALPSSAPSLPSSAPKARRADGESAGAARPRLPTSAPAGAASRREPGERA